MNQKTTPKRAVRRMQTRLSLPTSSVITQHKAAAIRQVQHCVEF